MDFLKEAFDKVKKDISFLNEEIFNIKEDMTDLRESMIEICNILKEVDKSSKTDVSKNPLYNMNLPTDNAIFKPLNHQNQRISIGNTGVPTDRQTNRQTDKQILKIISIKRILLKNFQLVLKMQ